ncbi:hypothetical protein HNR00_003414 [Methylorubrum rhodinum]|uniref:Uncharacterized protein n=1 Tax=Methylorubrum rhodinum TaxID=29428 RepID=A0A840ZP68_9HYPH|nr:hypothetical protein [Methylorubrum rhodinum]MBB5758691.1 hypothetical protein [Methylorubrum rhodinum]
MTHSDEDIIPNIAAGHRPTLTLDVALYDSYLEGSGLAEDERRALLEDLWAIIVGFVDLGFVVEPAAALADKSDEMSEEFARSGSALVDYSTNSTTDHFERAAAPIASAGD